MANHLKTLHTVGAAYGKIASTYDVFLTITGFKRGIENFLERQTFELPHHPKILDAGCGTGLIARYLARRYPDAEIYASDIDIKMLREMERIVLREGISRSKILIAQGDLAAPAKIRDTQNGEAIKIPEDYFDAVIVSAALEHVPLVQTLVALKQILKPGGVFLNIGMRDNPAGAILGMMYHCRPYKIIEMRRACERAGFDDIRLLRLKAEDFPANLSRIAIIAQRPESKN